MKKSIRQYGSRRKRAVGLCRNRRQPDQRERGKSCGVPL